MHGRVDPLAPIPPCSATTSAGRPCRVASIPGTTRCYFHPIDAEGRERLKASQRKGYQVSGHIAPSLRHHQLDSDESVVRFQRLILDSMLDAEINATTARAAVEIARLIFEGSKAAKKLKGSASTASQMAKELGSPSVLAGSTEERLSDAPSPGGAAPVALDPPRETEAAG